MEEAAPRQQQVAYTWIDDQDDYQTDRENLRDDDDDKVLQLSGRGNKNSRVREAVEVFEISCSSNKLFRSWMPSSLQPSEARQLRKSYNPSFRKRYFDLKYPRVDHVDG